MVTVFHYPTCTTCKKAFKWLRDHDVAWREAHIVERPPSTSVLKNVMRLGGIPVKKLFNVSGQAYRDGGYKGRVGAMSEDEMLHELAANGMLIKRPILIGDGFALVGFDAEAYAKLMGR